MNQTSPIPLTLFNGQDSAVGITNQTCEFQITKGSAKLLEMEDVLFHHNSAVMMPDNPTVSSGGTSSQQQMVSGVRALSLVFRQHQTYPDQKVLLAGHADRSGDAKTNFQISSLRARNVLFLLQGKRSEWADICVQRHKIEDYQQILTYFAKEMNWDCNPGTINNQWNTATAKAVQNFITLYNFIFAFKPADAHLDDGLFDTVKNSGDKGWLRELWQAVFDLYQHDLVLAATGKHIADESFVNLRGSLQFGDAEKPFVACGESFPISQNTRQNYRSQQDRRVEVLFFNDDELPVLNCPLRDSSVHTEDECPIYNKLFYNFEYINPDSFFTATYHIKFIFYNRITKDITSVPTGLQIKTWKEGATELETTVNYDSGSGIYQLTVKGITNAPREQNINFTFETTDSWICTANDKAMILKILTEDDVSKLSIDERNHCYSLPRKWDSRNWMCNLGGGGGKFSNKVLNVTSATDPLIFNLDAIVLVNDKGIQEIYDAEYDTALKKETKVGLSAESRIALLYLDHNDSNKLKIYNERTDARHYSLISFEKNFISDTPKAVCRIVYFNNTFYDISLKRTEPSDGDIASETKKYVCGAVAAVAEDPDIHVKKTVCVNLSNGASPNDYAQEWCGNYELHFFDSCGILDNQPLAYLMIYWNCRFVPDDTNPAGAGAIANWVKDGMVNSMEYSNRPYIIMKKDGECDRLIRPFHYYEAKSNNRNGKHKCTVGVTTEDVDWMLPEQARFCYQSYAKRPAYYGPDTVKDVDGAMAVPLMSAHEMGHATGCLDDYLYDLKNGNYIYSGVPSFEQPHTAPGGPYNLDDAARMRFCRLPRMRNIWHFVNWLNDDAKEGKPLNDFLNGSSFKMAYTFTDPSTAANRTIEIDLTDDKFRDTSSPSYKNESFASFGNGDVALYLYKLGGGETAETIISGHILQGILSVNIKIALKFVGMNADRDRQDWINNKLLTPLTNLNRKFYLLCNVDNKFKKALLSVTPYFALFNGASGPAGTHYSIIVDNATSLDIVTSGAVIHVKRTVDGIKIVRYILGLPTNSVAALTKSDFNPVASWIGQGDVANGVFTVEDV